MTVAEPAVAGPLKSPLALMAPTLADQLTAELKPPVPVTVAVHCEVVPATMVDGLHAACTEVMMDAGAFTVTKTEPDLVGSCILVAVTVTAAAVAGDVKSPLELTLPALADQVTAEL